MPKKNEHSEWMHHDFMSAGEYALKILVQAGIIEEVDGSFIFIKDGIGIREIS